MSSRRKRESFVPLLVARFPDFLAAFERNCPFTRYGQLEYHVRTINRRAELGSAEAALHDESFLRSLYSTLQAWGIGSRASHLCRFEDFAAALRKRAPAICELDVIRLDQPTWDADIIQQKLWTLMESLDIVMNDTCLVPGSKALHHILPELVVPIDRAYTQDFFRWGNPQFQYGQARCFREAFNAFVAIARRTGPRQYVGGGWNTSQTKVIDNAIVGMFC